MNKGERKDECDTANQKHRTIETAQELLPFRKAKSQRLYVTSQKQKKGHLSRYQAYRIVKAAGAFAGLNESISCHSLRKTFGYHAWKQGTAPALLMSIFNHSAYQITKRYLCIEQDDKDEVFAKIKL